MDQERSAVCLKYARKMDLQLIVCVPDERLQSLIRNAEGFLKKPEIFLHVSILPEARQIRLVPHLHRPAGHFVRPVPRLFTDDMAIFQVYEEDGARRIEYNFTYLDLVMDNYRSCGLRPFLELGFVPHAADRRPAHAEPGIQLLDGAEGFLKKPEILFAPRRCERILFLLDLRGYF